MLDHCERSNRAYHFVFLRNFVATGGGFKELNLTVRSKVANWLLLLPLICDDEHVSDDEQVTRFHRTLVKKKKPLTLQLSRGRKFGCRTWLLLPPFQHVVQTTWRHSMLRSSMA